MSAMSDYLENKLLDHILATTAYTAPSAVYLGLSIASMGENAGGTELTGNGYARVSVAFDAASGGTTDNTAVVDFPACTGSNWGAVAYWSIWDASTGGNMLLHGAFTSAKTIEVNDVLRVAAGDLDITAA
jgi:hypothetical protein